MIRIKDPETSLAFYKDLMHMTLMAQLDFPEWNFSLYFMASMTEEQAAALPPIGSPERYMMMMMMMSFGRFQFLLCFGESLSNTTDPISALNNLSTWTGDFFSHNWGNRRQQRVFCLWLVSRASPHSYELLMHIVVNIYPNTFYSSKIATPRKMEAWWWCAMTIQLGRELYRPGVASISKPVQTFMSIINNRKLQQNATNSEDSYLCVVFFFHHRVY